VTHISQHKNIRKEDLVLWLKYFICFMLVFKGIGQVKCSAVRVGANHKFAPARVKKSVIPIAFQTNSIILFRRH
jgi:hypothetical protein